jgi:hypothetical protein
MYFHGIVANAASPPCWVFRIVVRISGMFHKATEKLESQQKGWADAFLEKEFLAMAVVLSERRLSMRHNRHIVLCWACRLELRKVCYRPPVCMANRSAF